MVQEIARFHKKGRPILVGTTSVESSELLAGMLREQGAALEVEHMQTFACVSSEYAGAAGPGHSRPLRDLHRPG